jgi:uncharacterized protein YbcV (DUF1398 family)
MNAELVTIAEGCLAAASDKTMSFPEIVGTLIGAGFEGYVVDYRLGTTSFFLPDGEAVVLGSRPSEGKVAAAFDVAGVVSEIRWAQANPPDYSYAAFSTNVKAHGCAGYIVSFSGRRVLYFGRTAETHTEHFPQ